QPHEAEQAFRAVVRIDPGAADALNNLGVLLGERMALEEAEATLGAAIRVDPGYAEAYNNLGLLLTRREHHAEAEAAFREAIRLRPAYREAYNHLGLLLERTNRESEAEAACREVLRLTSDAPVAYVRLGDFLYRHHRMDEAEEAYRAATRAAPRSEDAGRPDPCHIEAYNNLGMLLTDQGRHAEAEAVFQKALRLDAGHADTHARLGRLLHKGRRVIEAEAAFREALRLAPDSANFCFSLANTLIAQARFHEAEEWYRLARTLQPTTHLFLHSLLFQLMYHPDKSLDALMIDYRDYDERFVQPYRKAWLRCDNLPDPHRRLRVGYVSPDFRKHSINGFVEPLLARHDRSRFERYAYAELAGEDDVTVRYRGYMDHWIPTRGMTDEALTERIRADRIDILVDLAGHTSNGRLGVFARKPAPVSVTWLFGFTTGVSAIDYHVTDAIAAPPGSEPYFLERLWRLGRPALAYRPPPDMGEVSPLPALKRGHVTFGSFGRSIRMNHRVIMTWSRILLSVPDARLMIYSSQYQDDAMRQDLIGRFARYGIGAERLDVGCVSPAWDAMRGLDIGLDCFPHNSGITMAETLYMGIPAISLEERITGNGLGALMLHTLGLSAWIARTQEEYVEKAVALANDLPTLVRLRADLRVRMEKSPLMDEEGFARAMEDAYRAMWQRWCQS
ncbi:MAG: tetratricopeptide repeat protein, partial [Magnetococcales bacterium]|nr:tetratricopeptide repeat protein [Magnetococcales bacterium]